MKKKWTKKAEPRLCLSFFLLHSKLLIELINSTLCGSSLLVSGVERMTLGTDFHVNLRLCWTGYKGVSTVTGYGCLVVAWMNVFSHFFPLSAWFPTMRIRLSAIGLLGFHKAKSALAKIRYHRKEKGARAEFTFSVFKHEFTFSIFKQIFVLTRRFLFSVLTPDACFLY